MKYSDKNTVLICESVAKYIELNESQAFFKDFRL